jgi:hypothetical protein
MKAGPPQPKDLGDIVSAAWFLCLRHWRTVFLMALLTLVASAISYAGFIPLEARLPSAAGAHPVLPQLSVELVLLLPLGIALLLFNQLAFMRFGLEVWIGEGADLRLAYRVAARCFLPALAAAVVSATVFAVGIVTWIGIPVAMYLAVCWFFAGQVCLAEGETNPFRALRRSRSIVRGAWWRAAGVLSGVTLLGLLPSLLIGLVRASDPIALLILSAGTSAITAPFLAGAQTMLYLDLRVRKNESLTLAPRGTPEPL